MKSIERFETVQIAGVDHSASGCLDSSISFTVSPDGQELSILFDEFSATNGQAICHLSIPIEIPAGYQFSLYNIDYRGFVAANTSASLRIAYSFVDQIGSGFNKTFQDETNYDLQDNLVTLVDVRWSNGDRVNLQIDLSLTATGNGSATIDSLDFAHKNVVYYPSPSPIYNIPNNSPPELFDFRTNTTDINATFTIYRDAFYDNIVYLYTIQDETGAVLDPISQQVLKPTDADYLQAALRNAIADVKLRTPNQTTTTVNAILPQGSLLAPAIVINSDKDALLDNNFNNDPTVYTPFILGNADKTDHILLLDNNNFVFEDLAGGGDLDYNDIILIATFQPMI
jgi:Domain of unknown function (DUF4360)/Domain of unknown function (DUF4114)